MSYWDWENLIIYEPIDNTNHIPAKQYDIIQVYLEERKPAAVLEEIEGVVGLLREAIEKNFSLRDILLNIGDRRFTPTGPSVDF